MTKPSRVHQQGFTLVELMITVLVAAILLTIAVPSFTTLIRKSNVSSASNALLSDMEYARSEAITRGTTVAVCPSNTGTGCLDNQTYDSGWLVYIQPAGAAAGVDYAAGDTILRYTQAVTGASIQSQIATNIAFGPQGTATSGPTATATMSFLICYRTGTTGIGTSTATVLGTGLTMEASGEIYNVAMTAGQACNY